MFSGNEYEKNQDIVTNFANTQKLTTKFVALGRGKKHCSEWSGQASMNNTG